MLMLQCQLVFEAENISIKASGHQFPKFNLNTGKKFHFQRSSGTAFTRCFILKDHLFQNPWVPKMQTTVKPHPPHCRGAGNVPEPQKTGAGTKLGGWKVPLTKIVLSMENKMKTTISQVTKYLIELQT